MCHQLPIGAAWSGCSGLGLFNRRPWRGRSSRQPAGVPVSCAFLPRLSVGGEPARHLAGEVARRTHVHQIPVYGIRAQPGAVGLSPASERGASDIARVPRRADRRWARRTQRAGETALESHGESYRQHFDDFGPDLGRAPSAQLSSTVVLHRAMNLASSRSTRPVVDGVSSVEAKRQILLVMPGIQTVLTPLGSPTSRVPETDDGPHHELSRTWCSDAKGRFRGS